jgi:hypothetical protein
MRRIARFAAGTSAIIVLGLATACGGSTSPTTPTTPAPVLTTETFTGTIAPLGIDSHTFTVNYAASYSDASVTITSLSTVSTGAAQTIAIGVGFGSTNLGVCSRASNYTNPAAPLNTELQTSGAPFTAGPYCVQLFDNTTSPTVTEPLKYSITVKHY